MFLRIISAPVKPGQTGALARKWESFQKTRLGTLPGFNHAYLAENQAGDHVLAVTVWDSRPEPAMAEKAVKQFAEQVQDLLTGPPTPVPAGCLLCGERRAS